MAWIYLAASGDSVSHLDPGSDQSPIVKTSDTLKLCCCREFMMADSHELQSGTTLHRLAGPCYQVTSISSMADFPARTLVLQDLAAAWSESEADFIGKSQGLSVKQTRDLYFSKMSQQLELGASTLSSNHLPSSGMTVDGRLYQPKKLAPRTCANGGSFLPTPAASSYGTNQGGAAGRVGRVRASLETMARKNLWPTPRASDGSKGAMSSTPTTQRRVANGQARLSEAITEAMGGGQLSPTWVEWLMGYPNGWAALEGWATQWFLSRRKQLLKDSQAFNA